MRQPCWLSRFGDRLEARAVQIVGDCVRLTARTIQGSTRGEAARRARITREGTPLGGVPARGVPDDPQWLKEGLVMLPIRVFQELLAAAGR